ncbi:uncharacterized protein LOC120191852 [Hibiscus syriacus]|uniref:uncharacterized protein LOC120191852 n=1 Tax=Hibiscus syriacus TaxID=106335 RepID=UPI0019221A0F|nr:uncharacterized protein LOC120191852 [Hibiscus syriacus]
MGNWSLLGRLRRVMRKVKLLLNFGTNRCRVASMIGDASRRLSFMDRSGLSTYVDNVHDLGRCSNRMVRTVSYRSEDDIDVRAEMFIANFHRQLRMERQVSLQFKYLGGYTSP